MWSELNYNLVIGLKNINKSKINTLITNLKKNDIVLAKEATETTKSRILEKKFYSIVTPSNIELKDEQVDLYFSVKLNHFFED